MESWTHYNEWGEITHNAVLKCGQRELDLVKNYTGHEYDAVLNQYYAKARMYDAENRRFTAMDPILDGSRYDLREYVTNPMQYVQYLYVLNNPIIYIDPTGLNTATLVLEQAPQYVQVAGTVLTLIATAVASIPAGTVLAVVAVVGVVAVAVTAGVAYYNSTQAWDTPRYKEVAKQSSLKVKRLNLRKVHQFKGGGESVPIDQAQSYMDKVQCETTTTSSNPVLVYGSSGEYVTTLQRYLTMYGYYSDKIDGHFGPNTEKAVQSFQRVNGLEVDGSCGPITWEKILSGNVLAVEEAGEEAPEEKGDSKPETPNVEYPGDDPTVPPGDGFEWRGKGAPGSKDGNWYNPKTGEQWNPDLNHAPPKGPHWDYNYKGSGHKGWRVFPDGSIEWKG